MIFTVTDIHELSTVAKAFLQAFPKGGVFGLRGPLVVGKTTFVKALVLEWCQKTQQTPPRVTSPSFVVHMQYSVKPTFHHFDFYRLVFPTPESLIEVGYWETWEEAVHQGAYVFVEWSEKASQHDLKETALVDIQFSEENHRRIQIEFKPVS